MKVTIASDAASSLRKRPDIVEWARDAETLFRASANDSELSKLGQLM